MGSILGSFQRGLLIVYQLLIDFSPCPGNSQWHRQSQKDFLCASFSPFRTNTEIKISNKNAEWSWRPWGYNLPSSFSFELASNYLLHLTLTTRHSSKLLTSIINSLVPSMKPMWGEYDHYCVSQRKRLRHRGQVICSQWYSVSCGVEGGLSPTLCLSTQGSAAVTFKSTELGILGAGFCW